MTFHPSFSTYTATRWEVMHRDIPAAKSWTVDQIFRLQPQLCLSLPLQPGVGFRAYKMGI